MSSRSSSLGSLAGGGAAAGPGLPELASDSSSSLGSLAGGGADADSLFTSSASASSRGTLDSLDSMSSLSSADLGQFPAPPAAAVV